MSRAWRGGERTGVEGHSRQQGQEAGDPREAEMRRSEGQGEGDQKEVGLGHDVGLGVGPRSGTWFCGPREEEREQAGCGAHKCKRPRRGQSLLGGSVKYSQGPWKGSL